MRLFHRQSQGRACYCIASIFDLVKVAGVRARDQQNGLFSVLGTAGHGPVYIFVKHGLLVCKYVTVERGEMVAPLKGRLQGSASGSISGCLER